MPSRPSTRLRQERYYWGALLVTFGLGTAGGDQAIYPLSLGFRYGALIFGELILAAWVTHGRAPAETVGRSTCPLSVQQSRR